MSKGNKLNNKYINKHLSELNTLYVCELKTYIYLRALYLIINLA